MILYISNKIIYDMIKIKSKLKDYAINFPSNVDEITVEDFKEITKNVKLAPNYCIIALCFKTKLFDFVTIVGNKRNATLNVVPSIAAISEDDAKLINGNIGDNIIINRSSLERGIHISLPTIISSSNAEVYFKADKELCKAITTGNLDEYLGEKGKLFADSIVLLEFKIVPINDIVACLPMNNNITDPFIIDESGNKTNS